MTESDYESPLLGFVNIICQSYSKMMYHDLVNLQHHIRCISDILDNCDDSIKMNSYFQKLRHYTERIETQRLKLLEFMGYFDESIFQITSIINRPCSRIRMKFYYQDDTREQVAIFTFFQEIMFDKRNVVSVLKLHGFLLEKISFRAGFQPSDEISLVLDKLQEIVECITKHSNTFTEAFNTIRIHLNQEIRLHS